MFSLKNLIAFCKYKKTECDACNALKKSWDKGKRRLKRSPVTLFWKVPQFSLTSNRWGYQDCLSMNIHQGLSLCKQRLVEVHHCAKFCERIVSQFKDNVSQCKIAKNLGRSPFIVSNIVKRICESEEISVRKGQTRKPLLNARDHRALRRDCLRNRHANMTRAREYFGN